jgi:transcription elongation factor Elf1
VRLADKDTVIKVENGKWDCPICQHHHFEGKGVNKGFGTTSFTCDSCGDIAMCQTAGCDNWVAVNINPRCVVCGVLRVS